MNNIPHFTKLVTFALIVFGVAQASADSSKSELGVTDSIMKEVLAIAGDTIPKSKAGDLPEGSRQILHVYSHRLFSSGYRKTSASGRGSDTVILLSGKASPSSDQNLKRAYIIIAKDDGSIQTPRYDKKQGVIYIWIHQRSLATLLTQVHEPKLHCWIGHFANGHIYGDVHGGH